jgi:ketosteroid isomerase-like protein
MALDEQFVRNLFKGLEKGDGAEFFEHVDENVDWIVEGTYPLAVPRFSTSRSFLPRRTH